MKSSNRSGRRFKLITRTVGISPALTKDDNIRDVCTRWDIGNDRRCCGIPACCIKFGITLLTTFCNAHPSPRITQH